MGREAAPFIQRLAAHAGPFRAAETGPFHAAETTAWHDEGAYTWDDVREALTRLLMSGLIARA